MNGDILELDETTIDVLTTIYERDGKLTAEVVVDEATDPASPLHDRFEWDDSIAAHEYRLEQARSVIRACVTVLPHGGEKPVRAFVHLRSEDSYIPTDVVMSRSDWRDEVLADFKRDADRFRAKWSTHKFVAAAYAAWIAEQAQ